MDVREKLIDLKPCRFAAVKQGFALELQVAFLNHQKLLLSARSVQRQPIGSATKRAMQNLFLKQSKPGTAVPERRMIMRLIDADRAMEIVRDQGIAHPNAYPLTNYATLILREAPTVDAVEVVRCQECYHKTHDGSGKPYCLKLKMYLNKELDFFCKYGKRKEGAD